MYWFCVKKSSKRKECLLLIFFFKKKRNFNLILDNDFVFFFPSFLSFYQFTYIFLIFKFMILFWNELLIFKLLSFTCGLKQNLLFSFVVFIIGVNFCCIFWLASLAHLVLSWLVVGSSIFHFNRLKKTLDI